MVIRRHCRFVTIQESNKEGVPKERRAVVVVTEGEKTCQTLRNSNFDLGSCHHTESTLDRGRQGVSDTSIVVKETM